MKLILSLAALLLAASSSAQTAADYDEARAAHNRDACAYGKLPANCTDDQLGLALPGVRSVDATVYSTNAAFRDAVIVAPQLRVKLEQRRNRVIERLVQIVTTRPAKCVAILTAAALPTDVCK